MVRLLCQNFQPLCSGGSSPQYTKFSEDTIEIGCLGAELTKEMIDREMAERAVQAVSPALDHHHSNFNFNNFNNSSSGSDSCDSDGDHGPLTIVESEDSQSGNDNAVTNVDKDQRRKDRRRQRNKVSAQAYRQRRRQQNDSQVKVLQGLEEKHKSLLEKVKRLEEEKQFVEELLKKQVNIPWNYTTTHTWPYTITAVPIIQPPTGISPPPAEMMNMTSGPMDTPTMMETEAATSAS